MTGRVLLWGVLLAPCVALAQQPNGQYIEARITTRSGLGLNSKDWKESAVTMDSDQLGLNPPPFAKRGGGPCGVGEPGSDRHTLVGVPTRPAIES